MMIVVVIKLYGKRGTGSGAGVLSGRITKKSNERI
jgi:hypothetical protein